jgi:hypothetical protein
MGQRVLKKCYPRVFHDLSVQRVVVVTLRVPLLFYQVHFRGVKVGLPPQGRAVLLTNGRIYGLDARWRGQVTGELKKISANGAVYTLRMIKTDNGTGTAVLPQGYFGRKKESHPPAPCACQWQTSKRTPYPPVPGQGNCRGQMGTYRLLARRPLITGPLVG